MSQAGRGNGRRRRQEGSERLATGMVFVWLKGLRVNVVSLPRGPGDEPVRRSGCWGVAPLAINGWLGLKYKWPGGCNAATHKRPGNGGCWWQASHEGG